MAALTRRLRRQILLESFDDPLIYKQGWLTLWVARALGRRPRSSLDELTFEEMEFLVDLLLFLGPSEATVAALRDSGLTDSRGRIMGNCVRFLVLENWDVWSLCAALQIEPSSIYPTAEYSVGLRRFEAKGTGFLEAPPPPSEAAEEFGTAGRELRSAGSFISSIQVDTKIPDRRYRKNYRKEKRHHAALESAGDVVTAAGDVVDAIEGAVALADGVGKVLGGVGRFFKNRQIKKKASVVLEIESQIVELCVQSRERLVRNASVPNHYTQRALESLRRTHRQASPGLAEVLAFGIAALERELDRHRANAKWIGAMVRNAESDEEATRLCAVNVCLNSRQLLLDDRWPELDQLVSRWQEACRELEGV